MTLFQKAEEYGIRTAIVSNNRSYTYNDLQLASNTIAQNLTGSKADLNEARIAFLLEPSFEYVVVQWAIWKAGGIAVPLCTQHPIASMAYVIEDTGAKMIIADQKYSTSAAELSKVTQTPWYMAEGFNSKSEVELPHIDIDRRAMIIYTSGTTNKPKGAVTTHKHIASQITTLVKAWEWSENDYILNVLPLHHVHGIVNVSLCALWSGACCEFLPKFDPKKVWDKIALGAMTLFMGVPTMYYKLISYWENSDKKMQVLYSETASKMRLMVSGSAALPVPVLEKWKEITGHTLLERYGMTEIGMGLSNPYRGERRAGYVGQPFDGVAIRLVDAGLGDVAEGEPGEILIKGPSVFKEYWNKPDATEHAFTADGWFITGDVAVLNRGSYKILGRKSVDIIKSGGYKISALEIEEVLRKHPDISDCAVVGIPDDEWGEIIAAAIITKSKLMNTELLTEWLSEKLPSYKFPRRYKTVSELPRNVLGKVLKPSVKEIFM